MIFKKVYIFFMCALFVATHSITIDAQVAGKGRLIIIGCPDSAVVKINGTVAEHDIGGWYEVNAGYANIGITRNSTPVMSIAMNVKSEQDRKIVFECLLDCAQFQLNSTPDGALITIDDEELGNTPYITNYIRPGNHKLVLTLPGYAPYAENFSAERGRSNILNTTLNRSQAYKDSVKHVLQKQKRARQVVYKIIFGTLTAALAGAGAYFDMTASSALSKADEAAVLYDASRDTFQPYRDTYYNNRKVASDGIGKRNILFGASGVCLIGFGFSFVF